LRTNAVHLDHVGLVDQVEHAAVHDGRAHRVAIEIEVVLEASADPIDVAHRQLDNEVDVARHARHRVVVGRERSCQHVADPRGLQAPGDGLEDLQLFDHPRPQSPPDI
jgi:hypothetical protein